MEVTSQFYLINIKDHSKDYVLVIAVDLNGFLCFNLVFSLNYPKTMHLYKMASIFNKRLHFTNVHSFIDS